MVENAKPADLGVFQLIPGLAGSALMVRMKYFALLVLTLLFVPALFAQSKVFKWNDEMCEYEGTYDSKKYTLNQIRNTQRLLSCEGFRLSTTNATVWNYADIHKLDIAAVDAEYNDIIDELEHLEYVSTPYTNSVRDAKLKEARELYRLVRTTMAAYSQPKILRDYPGAEACRITYGEPIIAGGDKLVAIWRKVNLDSQSRNGDPQRLQERWEEQNASPDRLKFALVETMSFGWWNCANDLIPRSDVGTTDRAAREFRKLFIRVKTLQCDEP